MPMNVNPNHSWNNGIKASRGNVRMTWPGSATRRRDHADLDTARPASTPIRPPSNKPEYSRRLVSHELLRIASSAPAYVRVPPSAIPRTPKPPCQLSDSDSNVLVASTCHPGTIGSPGTDSAVIIIETICQARARAIRTPRLVQRAVLRLMLSPPDHPTVPAIRGARVGLACGPQPPAWRDSPPFAAEAG